MKVVFLRDVPRLGKKYEVKDVSDGFARNRLIPAGSVELATPNAIKRRDEAVRVITEKKSQELGGLLEKIKKVNGKKIEVVLTANERGNLFAGLHQTDVARIVIEKLGAQLPPDVFEFKEPIKEIGEHSIRIETPAGKGAFILVITKK